MTNDEFMQLARAHGVVPTGRGAKEKLEALKLFADACQMLGSAATAKAEKPGSLNFATMQARGMV